MCIRDRFSTAASSAGLSVSRRSRRNHRTDVLTRTTVGPRWPQRIPGQVGAPPRAASAAAAGCRRPPPAAAAPARASDGPRGNNGVRDGSDRHHGDVPADHLRAGGGGCRPPAGAHRRAARPVRPNRQPDRGPDGTRRPAAGPGRPAPAPDDPGQRDGHPGDAKAPPGRVSAGGRDRSGLGGRPRRGVPLGTCDERDRGAADPGTARPPHHLPVRKPDPGAGRAGRRLRRRLR